MKKIDKDLKDNILLYLFSLVSLIGVIAGELYIKKSGEGINFFLEESYRNNSYNEVFWRCLISKIPFLALSFLGGLHLYLSPLLFLSIFIRGYSYGFTAGGVVASRGFSGYIGFLSGVFLQNFLYFLLLIFYSSYGFGKVISSYLNRRNYDLTQKNNKNFLIRTLIAIVLMVVISALEGFFLMKYKG